MLAEIEALDTRTREQKIGDIPTKGPKKTQISLRTTPLGPKTDLNAAEKSLRLRAKRLCLDHVETIIMNMVDLALNSPSHSVQVEAGKQIMQHALGRPSTVHVGSDGQQIVPNFTIVFGDPKPHETIDASSFDFVDVEDDED